MKTLEFEILAERMIEISKTKPLIPEHYVPWDDEPDLHTIFMPDQLISLQGHPLWNSLTRIQQVKLGKLEVVQVMYSYAWSETLACLFFNRHMLTLSPESVENRFLIRETIEEFRHQEMFGMAIKKLGHHPVLPNRWHRLFGNITVKFLPASLTFMSVLSIEMMADAYAKYLRKDENVYSVLRKSSELHHIEEGRHIFYTKEWLRRYTQNASFLKRSMYSMVVLLSVYFMKTLYVQRIFFEEIGVSNQELYYKEALKNYKKKFAPLILQEISLFVQDFGGLNCITKPFWKLLLNVKL